MECYQCKKKIINGYIERIVDKPTITYIYIPELEKRIYEVIIGTEIEKWIGFNNNLQKVPTPSMKIKDESIFCEDCAALRSI